MHVVYQLGSAAIAELLALVTEQQRAIGGGSHASAPVYGPLHAAAITLTRRRQLRCSQQIMAAALHGRSGWSASQSRAADPGRCTSLPLWLVTSTIRFTQFGTIRQIGVFLMENACLARRACLIANKTELCPHTRGVPRVRQAARKTAKRLQSW